MNFNKFALAAVATLALTAQSVWAQTPVAPAGAGADAASTAAVGTVKTSTLVVGAVVAGALVIAAADNGTTGTTGSK
jgi:hypothetical protein